jgi:hypothetical protein
MSKINGLIFRHERRRRHLLQAILDRIEHLDFPVEPSARDGR